MFSSEPDMPTKADWEAILERHPYLKYVYTDYRKLGADTPEEAIGLLVLDNEIRRCSECNDWCEASEFPESSEVCDDCI
jgi:hypothetical protein